jgi:hypothetical protein
LRRLYGFIQRILSRPRADLWVILLGTLLVSPSIPSGLAADDFVHELALLGQASPIVGFRRFSLDLFRFASPDVNQTLVNEGVLPWWIDPHVRFAFFRPLASATHLLDHVLFADNAVIMHVHTVLWHVLTLVAVRALFRAVFGPGWLATLALCLYALDDARGSPVAWVANRNELISCALSVYVLTWHHRARRDARYTWMAPIMLAAGMLASEGAIAITAYLFAYELFVTEGALRTRMRRLIPYGAVILCWAALYRGLGYGIARSGQYFDPLRDPATFLRALPERFAMLWLAQLGGPWSEGWNAYPVMFPGLEYVVAGLAVVVIAGSLALFMPLLKRDRLARFWLVGAALATLPACGAFPADRLLPWIGIGGMAVTAQFFDMFLREGLRDGSVRTFAGAGAAAIVFVHLIVGPILLPLRSIGISQVRAALDRADQTIPADEAITRRVAIYVNPAADPFASYIPVTRAALGIPRPRTQRWLATATTPVHLTRIDERTLRVVPEGGFLILPSERLFRNARTNPFEVGEVIDTDGLRITVTRVTDDGRPAEVLARFDRVLEDPMYLWLAWKGGGYAPIAPPALGSSLTAPPADLVTVAYGPNSRVTKALSGRSLVAASHGP